jgi:putative redox protein
MPETESATHDVDIDERIHPIHVATEWMGRYQSINRIRDVPEVYLDEPRELGGKNSGATALETTLAALNSCTAMIMYILQREQKFDLRSVRFEADGFVDVRRVEMKKSGKLYSQVEPIADHYKSVTQRVFIDTSEPEERIDHFRNEVHRLCPMHCLLRDAGVPMETQWIVETA